MIFRAGARWALLLVAATGCRAILGIGDPYTVEEDAGTGDGSAEAGEAAKEAGAAPGGGEAAAGGEGDVPRAGDGGDVAPVMGGAGPSCAGLNSICGPARNESCCLTLPVRGGTFDRYNNRSYPAALSDFSLDKYEITVGRMRRFVAAYLGGKRPGPGDGAHPRIPGSGWREEWSSLLPDKAGLDQILNCPDHSWSDSPEDDRRPMNCLTYHLAFAFCAWDGGRLPTRAEWNYAAAGGNEQRVYPWSMPGAPVVIDRAHANYGVTCGCSARDLVDVGSLPMGNGLFGQADLAGNLREWNLDAAGPLDASCMDCARLAGGGDYVISGGSLIEQAPAVSVADGYNSAPGSKPNWLNGARCAR
jgi:formylglycine-generating enzyme required for sulfatase activity